MRKLDKKLYRAEIMEYRDPVLNYILARQDSIQTRTVYRRAHSREQARLIFERAFPGREIMEIFEEVQ